MTEIFEFLVLFLTFFASSSTNTAHRIEKTKNIALALFPAFRPLELQRDLRVPSERFREQNSDGKNPAISDEQ